MSRVHNFSPGPAAIPTEVLEIAQAELLDFRESGMSVMEMSHRSATFIEVAAQAEADFRELLAVPENYKVLFLAGGATGQFAAVPFNLMGKQAKADYVNTGAWSTKAIKEAAKYGQVNVAASSESSKFDHLPGVNQWQLQNDAAYLHICSNETIQGVQIHDFDRVHQAAAGVPIVADMSSDILSRPLDVSQFGVIYAGAQKNSGPAGVTVVVVRDDLLDQALPLTPTVWNYAVQAGADSMSNTPATFSWYLAGLVFRWLKQQGGLGAMQAVNERKAAKLYGLVEKSNFYRAPVKAADRSMMNVPFTLPNADLDKVFLDQAHARGLMNLKGHRAVGGMRASIYNAVSEESVDALVDFMTEFEVEQG